MRAVYFAAALLISGFAMSAASAAPAAPVTGVSQQHVPVIDVQYRQDYQYRHDDRRHYRRHVAPPPRYRAGHRYGSAPRGWHRYDRRPGDWSRRGCVMVGPVWFCP
ncbi:hypothetical protein DXH78_09390 [Undibacter mobilis]|uniref:Uncharacterized protein n=1 Tax=Undibacter mobilis TaxID=2292256 RepID=A0A371BB76_9BRAD|nr:hypothetical protein DXH78_09390 [Undibacter mobilis]